MNDDEECMESVAPVAEGTVPSGRGGLATIVKECCGKHAVSCGGKEAGRDARFRRISLLPVLSWMVYHRLIVTLIGYYHFDQKHMPRPSLRFTLIEWGDSDAGGGERWTLRVSLTPKHPRLREWAKFGHTLCVGMVIMISTSDHDGKTILSGKRISGASRSNFQSTNTP
jgi:hypothetical protein